MFTDQLPLTEDGRNALEYVKDVILFGDVEEIPIKLAAMDLTTVVDCMGHIIDQEAYWRVQIAAYIQSALDKGKLYHP